MYRASPWCRRRCLPRGFLLRTIVKLVLFKSHFKRGHTLMFYPHIGIRIPSVFAQAAKRADELVILRRRKYATTVVLLRTQFALDSGVTQKIRSTSSANATSIIQPILIDILTKSKLRSSTLLRSNSCWLSCDDTMQACKIQAK